MTPPDPAWLEKIFKVNSSPANEAFENTDKPRMETTTKLLKGSVNAVIRRAHVIRIVSGKAWLTIGGKDFLLNAGDELELPRSRDKVLISSTDDTPLIYELDA